MRLTPVYLPTWEHIDFYILQMAYTFLKSREKPSINACGQNKNINATNFKVINQFVQSDK